MIDLIYEPETCEAIRVKTTHGAAAEALVTQGIGDLKAQLN